MFQPLLAMPVNDECDVTRDNDIVVVRVRVMVVVESGLTMLKTVDVKGGTVTVGVVCELEPKAWACDWNVTVVDFVITTVVVTVVCEALAGTGNTVTVSAVEAKTTEAPLLGEAPSQLVVPSVTMNESGACSEVDDGKGAMIVTV